MMLLTLLLFLFPASTNASAALVVSPSSPDATNAAAAMRTSPAAHNAVPFHAVNNYAPSAVVPVPVASKSAADAASAGVPVSSALKTRRGRPR